MLLRCGLALLLLGPLPAGALGPAERDWLLRDALRAILAAMPEESDRALSLVRLRFHPRPDAPGLMLCGRLDFADAEAGGIGVALLYDSDAPGRPRRAGAPFFHGLEWLRGALPPADRCAEAEGQRALDASALPQ
ncbi:hypothetical protein BKE38_08215 [Pseudoroseomonas deserti]|uniref:Uncharacterized protein n=1 Tax=Teichococcus deserti TaxID=1817963 RepID=A0A1V2H6D1_9PROT|nr:hypothetical protein [Pseudoroseomonas deserti]ONG55828.1 hypothetical protein BKE38_08215 [Pseudoroseomonas deserti]